MTIKSSTISANTASGFQTSGFGGAINNLGTLTISNTTVSGNFSFDIQGGINSSGTMSISHSTITANNPGGFELSSSASLVIRGTIFAGNTAFDCFNQGSMTSQGHNLVGNNSGCAFTSSTGDQVGTSGSPIDPKIGSLSGNGGPTFTHALLSGSTAINAGTCTDIGGSSVTADQRGVSRPQGSGCDIGAVEVQGGVAIPGLSQWGLIAMAALLGLALVGLRWRRSHGTVG